MSSRNYEEIAARFWNLPHKADEEARREQHFMDDIILKAHLDREIEARLDGVETVFDGGAGTGRFSIPLAKKGLRVTHFDISRPMIEKAKELAAEAGVSDRIEFVEGALTELTRFEDGRFDLVISLDAPVSYTYPRHDEVLRELVRLAKKAVIVSVSSRLGYLPYFFNPNQKLQYIVDEDTDDAAVRWYVTHSTEERLKEWESDFDLYDRFLTSGISDDPDELYEAMSKGETPWPVNYGFLPEELMSSLESCGLTDIRLAGPGALSRSIPRSILKRLLRTEDRDRFLDLCYDFDSRPFVCGLGKDNLVASGVKQ